MPIAAGWSVGVAADLVFRSNHASLVSSSELHKFLVLFAWESGNVVTHK